MAQQMQDVALYISPNNTMITLKFSEEEEYRLDFVNYTVVEDFAQDKLYKFNLHSIPKKLLDKVTGKQVDSKLKISQWLTFEDALSTSLTLSMFDTRTLEEIFYEANSTTKPKLLVDMPEKGNILELSILIPVNSFKTVTLE